ncbi:small G protein signaling modulator 1-like isoform X3 [Apostichopus japonicus]|uniref:small G protein signaling modulator 1-like isoform X3 n=1 Tax=Stichopus japonicus TaxID=307972 RepID=UPI003AB1BA61
MANTPDEETKDRLLRGVKKEVKQIMEEAVTRKFVHEDSGSIISLCAAVEACLSHGLKRSLVSILKGGNTTVSLLKQVAKGYPPAGEVITKVQEIESRLEANKKSMNGDSPNKPQYSIRAALQQRHLWIRVALFEKHLAKIVEHLHENCGKYYEKEAYLADPVHGPILASLLVGPCALDYSKMKTADHYWTDPPADELVQRHRIHSNALASGANSPRRPGLQVKKTTGNTDEHRTAVSARDYVESLHQNSRSQLLYGKNNVLVQPKEDAEQIPGYLSLHQTLEHLTIKWTPNQLMNGAAMEEAEEETDKRFTPQNRNRAKRKNGHKVIYWDYALTVNLEDIVYLHCHQQPDCGGTLVLVGQDGVQYPPIHFPCGGHLLAFLTCLENGLLPRGLLDPPLWLQRGKGKVLPKLKRKSSAQQLNPGGSESTSPKEGTQIFEGEEATDYVFRIISAFKPDIDHDEAILHSPPKFTNFPWSLKDFGPRHQLIRQNLVQSLHSPKSVYAPLSPVNELSSPTPHHQWAEQGSSIKLLCDTMRKQIISRAFYGWLAHCRHLRTVRTHLSGLVHPEIIWSEQRQNEEQGMTEEKWRSLFQDDRVIDEKEVMRSIYFGGVQHEIRHEVWPYLLGHYQFGLTEKERNEIDESTRINFEQILAEWMAVETIINQRERDTQAAKVSSDNSSDNDLLDSFSLNLHRIDKDVQRCDRNYFFFTTANLEKLRNVMCTYVWEHLDVGYVQGMCDLVAPLLVILEDEAKTYNCFCELMKRMCKNFPHGGAMDNHFANMRSLIQILDSEMFELMHQNGDYTHFYFCYRWFLLDFKRELVYDDTFSVWETIWTAKHCASANFVLFIALALVEYYRDIILDNNMDFTDIIKFFNEMAERHDAKAVLKIARELVHKVQTLIENK